MKVKVAQTVRDGGRYKPRTFCAAPCGLVETLSYIKPVPISTYSQYHPPLDILHTIMDNGNRTIMITEAESFGDTIKKGDIIDRSNVRILLCDTDTVSCQEVSALLSQCSYQVKQVYTAAGMSEVLNSEGCRTDIILAEANILLTNGAFVLLSIVRDEALQHIPVIVMLTENDVSLTLKGLGLGVADYLLKPISASVLLNLWTHTRC